ncbi:beta-ketoacyl-[acyl-carrier-protein] synthase II, partial [bacterium]|nr:beta-ketoacyl-[acyl-carrier-protein] synthase II [bacterium]
MDKRRVVITGFGAISPVGLTAKETWEGLQAGKSGTDLITLFDATEYISKIAAEVKGFDPQEVFGRKEARKLDRYTQFA